MAGSFGFEEEKYDVSMAIGELELLPAVRQAPADSLIIADGFSCREQIAQGTDRHALHLAEVIAMALKGASKRRRHLSRDAPRPQKAGRTGSVDEACRPSSRRQSPPAQPSSGG